MNPNIVIYGCGRTGESMARYLKNPCKINRNTLHKKRLVQKADLVIVTLANPTDYKGCKSGYEMRLRELANNLPGVDELIHYLISSKTEVIAVTNPVDLFSRYISDRIHKDVHAFGLDLDKLRYSSYLSRDVDVVGFHGNAIPLLGLHDIVGYRRIISEVDALSVSQFMSKGINYDAVGSVFNSYLKRLFIEKTEGIGNKNLNSIEKKLLDGARKEFDIQYSCFIKHSSGCLKK